MAPALLFRVSRSHDKTSQGSEALSPFTGETMKVRALTFFAAILGSLACRPAHASIPHALRSTLMHGYAFVRLPDFTKGLDISIIQPVTSSRDTTTEDVSKLIPTDMKPTNDGGLVAAQILDRSFSTWFNSDAVKHSAMGRTAHDVEKSMEGDVAFGGKEPESIKHNIKFQVKAAQTQAQLEYTGITTAQVTYYVLQDKTNVEVREPVKSLNTSVVLNQISSHEETRKIVSLRWDW
jgi:hypothetical protein